MWPVLVPFALFAVGLGAIMPILVLGALSLGSTQAFAAAIVGIMGAVSLMATVPAGILIDRLGDFRAMTVATAAAIIVLGSIVAAFIWDSPYSLLVYTVALMVFGPVSDVWSLARQAVVAEVMPPADLAKAMTALGGTQRVGNLIGPMIGAGLMLVFPIWAVFVFSGLTAVAAIAIMALPIARRHRPPVRTIRITPPTTILPSPRRPVPHTKTPPILGDGRRRKRTVGRRWTCGGSR